MNIPGFFKETNVNETEFLQTKYALKTVLYLNKLFKVK